MSRPDRLPRRLIPAAFAALLALAACWDVSAPSKPAAMPLVLTPVDSAMDFPVYAAAPPGDSTRLLVVERGGVIWLRKNGVRQSVPFADLTGLTSSVTSGKQYGVLSLAFHPQYATNRRLFVYYIDVNEDIRLAELRANADFDSADPTPVATILGLDVPPNAVHFGGTIGFGPDGYLYVGLGDGQTGGSPSSPAQDSTSLFGKMLRLDVDGTAPYGIPPDNPFVGRPGWRGEIWLLGLRNPYRWSFDRATGNMWIGDVGEDRLEEITLIPRGASGANLGWPILEGNLCYRPATGCNTTGLLFPVLSYDHTLGCSVTGGVVYRGAAIPALQGTYLYGDFCRRTVRGFVLSGSQILLRESVGDSLPDDNVVALSEDSRGEVFVVMASGRLYRLDPLPAT